MSLFLMLLIAFRATVLKYLNAKVAYQLWFILPIYLLLPVSSAETGSAGGFMTFVFGISQSPVADTNESWNISEQVAAIVTVIWGSGCLLALASFLVRYQRLKGSFTIFSEETISERHDSVSSTSMSFLTNNKIRPVTSSLIDVPAVCGLIRSYLILPSSFKELSANHQTMILRHELFHINRHDHRFNFLRVIFKSLFWFNPLIYWADKYCEADQEISCDLGVMHNSDRENRKAYATALLETVTGEQQYKLISQWKYHSLIKERVKMLNKTNLKSWHSWVAAVFAIVAIFGINSTVVAENTEEQLSEAKPSVIVQPMYPRKAAEEGVEGWVKFEFDVDQYGHPYNVALVAAEPRRVFERDARRVIYQWEFEKNKSQSGLIYTMKFVLE